MSGPPIIIPMHTTTERQPSEAERIQIASLEVSTNEKEREMFRKGAIWYRDHETDNGVSPHGPISAIEVCAKINAIISEAPADMTFIFAVHNGGGAVTKVFSRQGKQAVVEAFGGIVMRINKLFGE